MAAATTTTAVAVPIVCRYFSQYGTCRFSPCKFAHVEPEMMSSSSSSSLQRRSWKRDANKDQASQNKLQKRRSWKRPDANKDQASQKKSNLQSADLRFWLQQRKQAGNRHHEVHEQQHQLEQQQQGQQESVKKICKAAATSPTPSSGAAVDPTVANNNNITVAVDPMIITSSSGNFTTVSTQLAEVTGIAQVTIPHHNNNIAVLFTAGRDAKLRCWDIMLRQGECTDCLPLPAPATCLLNNSVLDREGWIFVGTQQAQVIAWNVLANRSQTLWATPDVVGKVSSLTSTCDNDGISLIVAGTENGTILAWRYDPPTTSFLPFLALHGHTASVLTLEVNRAQRNLLYSGSTDGSIQVWDLATGTCIQDINAAHSSAVTKLLNWENNFLVSASLDGSIKVWGPPPALLDLSAAAASYSAPGQDGRLLHLHYVHSQSTESTLAEPPCSILSLCGMLDEQQRPLLFASYTDCKLRVWELPSFQLRDVITTTYQVCTLEPGSGSHLFLAGMSTDGHASAISISKIGRSCRTFENLG